MTKKIFLLLLVLLTLNFPILSDSVVYIGDNGAYGYCYGGSNLDQCALNACVSYGGKNCSYSGRCGKGFGAAAKSDDGKVGWACGYRSQGEADNAALNKCGYGCYLSNRWAD